LFTEAIHFCISIKYISAITQIKCTYVANQVRNGRDSSKIYEQVATYSYVNMQIMIRIFERLQSKQYTYVGKTTKQQTNIQDYKIYR